MITSLEYFKKMLPEGQFEEFKKYDTINDLFEESVAKFSDVVAMEWSDGQKTYKELAEDVAKLRGFYLSQGIKKGDVIGIVFANEYDYVKNLLALTTLGVIVANMPVSLPGQAIFGLSFKFTLKGLTYGDGAKAAVDAAKAMGLKIPTWHVSEIKDCDPAPADKTVTKKDGAVIVFTGGTTGSPKGGLLSHDNLTRGAQNGCYGPGDQYKLRYCTIIPFTHVFGLVRNLLAILMTGSTLYLIKEPSAFVKEMPKARPNGMVLVPALCSLVLMLIKGYGPAVMGGQLKFIIAGGAAVNPETIKAFDQFGISVCQGYGSTETTNLVTGNARTPGKESSVGRFYPNQEYKVVDGELWIKGDNVFMGYFNDPEATKATFEGEWIKTGDLVEIDEDGFVYIVGRCKNVIVFESGQKVSPEVIEMDIIKNPLIQDAVVSLIKNEQGTEILEAEVYCNPKAVEAMKLDEAGVYAAVSKVIDGINAANAEFEQIRSIKVRKEDFKRNGAMKILRGQ